jgi:CHAT domain-containing protein
MTWTLVLLALLLDASDVATLELDADRVVLSACNTAGPDGALGGDGGATP